MKYKIKKDLLGDIFVSVREMFPNEFMCFVGSSNSNNIIDEIVLFPTYNSTNSTSINLNNIPLDSGIIGSLHSHPSSYLTPSKADLKFFLRYEINIIFGVNNENNYKIFDKFGKEIELEVI